MASIEIPEGYEKVWTALDSERQIIDVDKDLLELQKRMGDKDVIYALRWSKIA